MARRELGLLILMTCLGGCIVETIDAFIPEPELPIKVRAQDFWSSAPMMGSDGSRQMSEREAIRDSIQQWNDVIGPRLKEGQPLPLEFEGYTHDEAFDPDVDILDRSVVIYKISDMTPALKEMIEAGGYPEIVVGYGLPGSDALVILGEFPDFLGPDPQPDADALLLRSTLCHELGHVLGVQHQHVQPGIMNEETPWNGLDEEGRFVRSADGDGFCLVHPKACK